MPAHHPSSDLIARYAKGDLPLGPSLTVSLHVDVCAACRTTVHQAEEAEGQVLTSLPDAELRPDALSRALDRLDVPDPALATVPAGPLPHDINLPARIGHIGLSAPVHLTPEAWVAHLDAPRLGGWRTYVFCGPANATLPEHGHDGDEFIMVLEGAFEDGRQFSAGDLVETKAGYVHAMQVSPHGRLVALISSHGPINWHPKDRRIGALLDI